MLTNQRIQKSAQFNLKHLGVKTHQAIRILHQTLRALDQVGYAHVANRISKIEPTAINATLINQRMLQNV